ncbi:receptor-like protein 7 [Pyrus x bretschneideri]|uniref:receptor-like protein 7 n=1 Tax=Pyrus x bretschneideri TaxID=225117 RepID=UPI00202E26EA|nr:receptor-like protein 7 [Pyrus x bretschneideri]
MTVKLIHLCINVIPVHSQCLQDEKLALLHFKQSLVFDPSTSSKLVSWNSSIDCCSWAGLSCSEGRVVGLDISGECISGNIGNSSSLFNLQHLQSLNLADNEVGHGSQIPSAIGKLTDLSYLNLSNTAYSGQIPIEISHLTRLEILDLTTPYFPGNPSLNLESPNLNVLIRKFSECPINSSLLKLQSLSVVRIENNNLSTQVPEFFSKFKNLTSLLLMNSGLYGTFPKKIFLVPTLQSIDLSGNPQLQRSLPEFPKSGSFQSLVLNGANFSGQLLPNSIGNLKLLSNVDVSTCNFIGSIPRSMEDLTQLVYLDLSRNQFNGTIPSFCMAVDVLMYIS